MKALCKIIVTLSFFGIASFSLALDSLSKAKVAELSLHRIERLVTLEDIDRSFIDKLQSLKVEVLESTSPDDPKFYVTASQYPGEDDTKNEVELWFNPDAKEIKKKWRFNVKPGSAAHNAPSWPVNIDAVTLVESATHYILDNCTSHEELMPYNEKLTSLTVSQIVRESGEILAQVDFEISDPGTPILRVLVKASDGVVDSVVFVTREF